MEKTASTAFQRVILVVCLLGDIKFSECATETCSVFVSELDDVTAIPPILVGSDNESKHLSKSANSSVVAAIKYSVKLLGSLSCEAY